MGYNLFDVLAAEGQYLTTNVDPRLAPGLDYALGTLVTFSPSPGNAVVLQKQSALGANKTSWVQLAGAASGVSSLNGMAGALAIAPGSGINVVNIAGVITISAAPSALWGNPSTVITIEASQAIAAGISGVFVNATAGNVIVTLPAPAASDRAIAITKTDNTANTVTVVTPSGLINQGQPVILPRQNQSIICISNLTNYQGF